MSDPSNMLTEVSDNLSRNKRPKGNPPEVETGESPVISQELLFLLNNSNGSVRKGALEGIIKSLQQSSKLSKTEMREACRTFVPVQTVQVNPSSTAKSASSKQEKKKDKALKKEGPHARATREDTNKYPLSDRGPNSTYASAIREARQRDKSEK
jgi:hypothetical protein